MGQAPQLRQTNIVMTPRIVSRVHWKPLVLKKYQSGRNDGKVMVEVSLYVAEATGLLGYNPPHV